MTDSTDIRVAATADEFAAFGSLIEEYVDWLGIDLGYQGLSEELADLPARYGPPNGIVLLAHGPASAVLGGIAVKPLSSVGSDVCEMKRLYVRPAGRGLGIGLGLIRQSMARARILGYRRMVLDTMPSRMPEAVALYRSLGFFERDAYYLTPIAETVFMEANLQESADL